MKGKNILSLFLILLILNGCSNFQNRMMLAQTSASCHKYNNANDCLYLSEQFHMGLSGFSKNSTIALTLAYRSCYLGLDDACRFSEAILRSIDIESINENKTIIEGFRNLNWGSSVDLLENNEIINISDEKLQDVVVIKKDENLTIEGIEVKKITYSFIQDMFYSVSIDVGNQEKLENLYKIYESKYGNFIKNNKNKNKELKERSDSNTSLVLDNTAIFKSSDAEKNKYTINMVNYSLLTFKILYSNAMLKVIQKL